MVEFPKFQYQYQIGSLNTQDAPSFKQAIKELPKRLDHGNNILFSLSPNSHSVKLFFD